MVEWRAKDAQSAAFPKRWWDTRGENDLSKNEMTSEVTTTMSKSGRVTEMSDCTRSAGSVYDALGLLSCPVSRGDETFGYKARGYTRDSEITFFYDERDIAVFL